MKLRKVSSREDSDFMYDVRTHPEVDEYLSGNPPPNKEIHELFLLKNRDYYYIAQDNEEQIGYCSIKPMNNYLCEIGFCVHPDFQGKGLGQELVKKTIEKAQKEYSFTCLFVRKNNKRGFHIYSKLGFKIIGEDEDQYFMCL
jgi:ribosomal protein S18 acetylase RimI-like enzyme